MDKRSKEAAARHVRRALTLLEGDSGDGARWTKGAFARDKSGAACSTGFPGASKFCVRGALWATASHNVKANWEKSHRQVQKASRLILEAAGVELSRNALLTWEIAEWNDRLPSWECLRDLLHEVGYGYKR